MLRLDVDELLSHNELNGAGDAPEFTIDRNQFRQIFLFDVRIYPCQNRIRYLDFGREATRFCLFRMMNHICNEECIYTFFADTMRICYVFTLLKHCGFRHEIRFAVCVLFCAAKRQCPSNSFTSVWGIIFFYPRVLGLAAWIYVESITDSCFNRLVDSTIEVDIEVCAIKDALDAIAYIVGLVLVCDLDLHKIAFPYSIGSPIRSFPVFFRFESSLGCFRLFVEYDSYR